MHLQVHDDPEVRYLRWITLDRPDFHNAYSLDMIDALIDALDQADLDPEVRVVALTGAGKSFSAGGDLKQMKDHSGMFEGGPVELKQRYRQGIHRVPRRIARFDKPILGVLNGACIGAGLDLACMCDFRIASERAKFGSTFVKLGLIPGDGGAFFLTRTIGYPKALELMLTARIIRTEEAQRIGLIHDVAPPDELHDRARDWAKRLLANGPLAVQMTKALARRSWHLPMEQALELAAAAQGIAQNSADHDEGLAALLEKRPANFSGE